MGPSPRPVPAGESRDLESLRISVRRSLPEIEQISDGELRNAVVEIHALALSETSFAAIEDIPASGVPGSPLMRRGTQADHYRGVARMSLAVADEMERLLGPLEIDRDVLLAGALVHDAGKAYEFCPRNRERWQQDRSLTGLPPVRHPVYGVALGVLVGMPEPVLHCIAAHAMRAEGQFVVSSVEARIIQYTDALFWDMLESANLLEPQS